MILVENEIIAGHWRYLALMVTRGHATETEVAREWLNSLPSEVMKTGCVDFDPAGLGFALYYGVDAILISGPLNDEWAKKIKKEEFVGLHVFKAKTAFHVNSMKRGFIESSATKPFQH